MFPSIQMHNTDCHCIRCNNNDQGVSRVSRRTAQRHNKRARFEAEKRSMEVDTEIIPTYQSDSVEAMDGQANSPISDAVSTFDNDVFVGNDYNGDESDTTDDNDSDDNGEEDTAEIYVEEFNNEDPFAASGMPENPVHRFIATFTVLFASRYVVNKGSVVLIEFINELLKIYGQDFQLPESLAGLHKMTGFLSITKGIKRFVSCPNCHCIYEENMSVPPHCVFTNVGARSPCGLRGTIIDPMHNLFLGTPKRMMDRWVDKKTIGAEEFAAMEKIAETMVLPRDYTKLTSKIGKGFPYMKADDWKSWVLVYSPVLLHGVLPFEMYNNWMNFVRACRYLIKPSITFDEVNSAHDYLEMFCKKATELYTPTILTCNMHLHLHLCETIRDFGPVYGYWLFGFERYNGLLKHIKTNGKDSFEATYMRSFVQNAFKGDYANAVLKSSSHVPFFNILSKLSPKFTPTTTVITLSSHPFRLQSFLLASSNPHLPPKGNEPLPPSTFPLQLKKSSLMDETDYAHLLQHYKTSYDLPDLVSYQYATLTNSFVDNEITKLKFIDLLGQQYRGKNGSASCGSLVHVMFVGSDGRNTLAYAGQVQYLFTHSFTHPSNSNLHLTRMVHDHRHVFAYIKWFNTSSDRSREDDGLEFCLPTFSPDSRHCIVSVHRIFLEIATARITTSRNVSKMLVIALPKKLYA
ncbi:hypothetical protein PHYBLDRAFT_171283 [Phycomyces blakesleeanus NRRL 1555(-)]|uniref:Transposase domain-containing protein n=1 Tax=Phycomyces blakesleeanus (strain ATCC 8743b / DSM 1359 / FGSC 10004 / NBRC 33097 / NRRL 1555) TaxID=763407 RepID=A0A162NKK9_PHYB8|nr:hypothetical protein PHYBLDRAFT_171283 [Phycomyces blakesleeanus NRRL 1555(-)]OAD70534.1 hypothetical protein PHYBLDRAFT_171283 [Phycomyces blakesleeanus NRRL 1555(-)]|eukprot:XP_018288574.1 hypothetical protein PHYBLDRAFT_171283 [Phycomyces blakesleeanus NRRL 1555(-)]